MIKKLSSLWIFSDIDGTMVEAPNPIPRRNLEALQRFTENGGHFAISTGRTVEAALQYANDLPVNVPSIIFNGGAIYDFAKKKMQDGVLKVEDGKIFSVHIITSKSSNDFELDKMECKIKVKLKVIRTESHFEEGKATFKLSGEEETRLVQTVERGIRNLYDFGVQNNVDILNIQDGFNKKYPRNTSQIMTEDFFKKVSLVVEVKVSQV